MRRMAYPNLSAVQQQTAQAQAQTKALSPSPVKTIPYDYVFKFELTGQRGNRVQNVVQISIEGFFVATSIGYSLVPDERKIPRNVRPVIDQRTVPQKPGIVPFFVPSNNQDAGKLNAVLVAGMPGAEIGVILLTEPGPSILKEGSIEPEGIVIVGLDTPIESSVIRIWDKTNNLFSELLEIGVAPSNGVGGPTINAKNPNTTVSTAPSTPVVGPNLVTNRLPTAGNTDLSNHIYGSPGDSINVFLIENATNSVTTLTYSSLLLEENTTTFSGRTIGKIKDPVVTNLSPGDVVLVRSTNNISIPFSMYTVPHPPRFKLSTLTLGSLVSGLEQIGTDLTRGLRLNPNFANLFNADLPLDQISEEDLGKIFETGCTSAEDVSFLYSIDVVGTGRELQSEPIHNIAGLGIANGDRPFRPFAKPIIFQPRSSTRIQIEELCGPPGTLYIVLQGYKLLGTAQIPE